MRQLRLFLIHRLPSEKKEDHQERSIELQLLILVLFYCIYRGSVISLMNQTNLRKGCSRS